MKELHSSQIRLKAFAPSKFNSQMAPVTPTYKEFCTPKKKEKLYIYSLLLSQKIHAHAKKSEHSLVTLSVFNFTQWI